MWGCWVVGADCSSRMGLIQDLVIDRTARVKAEDYEMSGPQQKCTQELIDKLHARMIAGDERDNHRPRSQNSGGVVG